MDDHRDLAGPYREGAGDPLDEAARLYELGHREWFLARFDDAERHLGRALALREALLPANDPLVIDARERIAALLHYQLRDADALFRDVLAARAAAHGEDALETAIARRNYGAYLRDVGHRGAAARLAQAEQEIRRAAGDDHPEYAAALKARAALELLAPAPGYDAFELADRAHDVTARVHPEGHPFVGGALILLARAHAKIGEIAAAQRTFGEAQATLEAAYGPDHPMLGFIADGLGDAAFVSMAFDDAIASWHRAVEIYERTYARSRFAARTRSRLVHARMVTRDPERAIEELDAGVAAGDWDARWLHELTEVANHYGFVQVAHRAAVLATEAEQGEPE